MPWMYMYGKVGDHMYQ